MIPIRNTYYMLAYAFQVLRQQGYREIATEEFASTAELLAEILIRGVRSQLKRGLGHSYVDVTEPLSSLRGKIEVTESLNSAPAIGVQLRRVFARHADEPDHQGDMPGLNSLEDLEASEERIAQTAPRFRGGYRYRARRGQLAYAF